MSGSDEAARDGGTGDQNLRARVAHLEDEIEQLAQNNRTLSQALGRLPEATRREALAAVGAAGLLSLSSSPAAADASTSDGDGDVGTPSTRVDLFADGVDTETLVGTHILDPDASDFGAAVNAAVAGMSAGETLWIPPVEYDHDTKAVIDKEIAIIGMGSGWLTNIGGLSGNWMFPRINKTSDVPILETQEGIGVNLERLTVSRSGFTNTTDCFILHGKSHVEKIGGYQLDEAGALVHFKQENSGDNLNNSAAIDCIGSRVGSVVRATNVSGDAVNLNSIETRGTVGALCGGWVVDMPDGVGGEHVVRIGTTGSGVGDGALRIGSDMFGKVSYLENNAQDGAWTGIKFEAAGGTGVIGRGLSTTSADFDTSAVNHYQVDTRYDGDIDDGGYGQTRIIQGTYTGDSNFSQTITTDGFTPAFVLVWPNETTEDAAVEVFFSTLSYTGEVTTTGSSIKLAGSGITAVGNAIRPDEGGFEVQGGEDVNVDGDVYQYVAIGYPGA